MATHFMTPDLPVLYDPESRAGKLVSQVDHARLQSRSGGDDLEGGTRFVGIVDAAVAPHGI